MKNKKSEKSLGLRNLANQEVNLSFEEFQERLLQEYEYYLDEGTSYLQKTAKISVEVASIFGRVNPF